MSRGGHRKQGEQWADDGILGRHLRAAAEERIKRRSRREFFFREEKGGEATSAT